MAWTYHVLGSRSCVRAWHVVAAMFSAQLQTAIILPGTSLPGETGATLQMLGNLFILWMVLFHNQPTSVEHCQDCYVPSPASRKRQKRCDLSTHGLFQMTSACTTFASKPLRLLDQVGEDGIQDLAWYESYPIIIIFKKTWATFFGLRQVYI